MFSQILQMFSRLEFEQFVRRHKAERHARGFTCWGQFVAMLFCQLGQAQSLREIWGGLACCEGKLRHLGVPEAPKRSTLAYANEHRPWELYQSVFQSLYQRCQREAGKVRRFCFRNPLVSLDATLIDLCASLYDWAKYQRTNACRARVVVVQSRRPAPLPTVRLPRPLEMARPALRTTPTSLGRRSRAIGSILSLIITLLIRTASMLLSTLTRSWKPPPRLSKPPSINTRGCPYQ